MSVLQRNPNGTSGALLWLVIACVAGCASSSPPAEYAPTSTVESPDGDQNEPFTPAKPAGDRAQVVPLPPPRSCVFAPTPDPVGPCAPDSADRKQAEQLLQSLDRQVSELTDASDPRAVNASLCRVLDHRCFQMVRSLHDAPAELVADSAMSFREFWDRGGRQWLLYALSLGDPDHDYLAATPTILPTYALETRAGHPLAPLLCSLADDDCGRDTAGWLLRAQLAMDTPRQREDRSGKQAECKDAALAQPEPARLSVWYQCISRIGLREAFPIGRFRAPDRGWLIIRGRRGHYQFCDEIRLYDVATGSVYVAQNCSGLFDFNRANMQTVPRSFVGCTSVDNLREWVLILALAGKAIDPMRPGEAFRIPAEIERSYTRSFEFTGRGRVFIHSSDQTHLPFAYYRDGQIVASGELVWPEHHNSALWHHAVELARVAEAGIVKGCALARFPTDLPIHTSPRGVSRVDAEPSHLSDINRGLRDELFALRERALCPATERGESARAPRARDARRRLVRVPSRER